MLPNLDPKLVQQAMKKMGIKQEDIPAEEVVIRTSEKEIVIRNPHVAKVHMMGEESFQISGIVEEYALSKSEDIQTVIDQTHCSEDEARSVLRRTKGDIAKAILELQQ